MLKLTATQLWALSIAAFWAATLLITLMDFAGDRLFGVSWSSGPDLFPNQTLGYPLTILQLSAAGLLLAAGAKYFFSHKTIAGGVLAFLTVVLTGVACFVGYTIAAFWYQFHFMGRSM